MNLVESEKLPKSISKYHDIGGVVEFAFFEDSNGNDDEIYNAIAIVLEDCNISQLRTIGYHNIDDREFFGEWYDFERGLLVKCGEYINNRGKKFTNPTIIDLEFEEIISGGFNIAEVGSGGQFAYAFCQAPYNLNAKPFIIQDLFEKIRDIILPLYAISLIYDFSSPELPKVSEYFEAGMEWWGVFLFAIYSPDLRRLIIIKASASD